MGLLCGGPVIWMEGGCLHARTWVFYRALGLFSYDKHMILNPEDKEIIVTRRLFWIFTWRHIIPFDRIQRIEYGDNSEIPLLGGGEDSDGSGGRGGNCVALRLMNPDKRVALFGFGNDMNWLDQRLSARPSRKFLKLIKELTGKSITG